MSESEAKYLEAIRNIYGDTNYFIDAITREYGFYGPFIDALRAGSASVNVTRKAMHKKIEDQWMRAIETCLPTIDYVTRNYSVGMEEKEEVLPIELSKKISNRSIQHLAQHTDYIKEYREDGTVVPSRILNVFRDETVLTYENKFLNTLLQRLYSFVEKRYRVLAGNGLDETGVGVAFDSTFQFGTSEGKLSLKIEVADPVRVEGADETLARLEKIRGALVRYMESPFVKQMGDHYIRPPVMRTNAMQKNKHLRECLDLWDFIESYEGLGYVIESEEQKEKPQDEFIRQIYSLMSLQYLMFDYNLHRRIPDMPEIIAARPPEKPITPRFVTHFGKEEVRDYNAYESEYRKVVNIRGNAARQDASQDEMHIRNIIEDALFAEHELPAAPKQSKGGTAQAESKQKQKRKS